MDAVAGRTALQPGLKVSHCSRIDDILAIDDKLLLSSSGRVTSWHEGSGLTSWLDKPADRLRAESLAIVSTGPVGLIAAHHKLKSGQFKVQVYAYVCTDTGVEFQEKRHVLWRWGATPTTLRWAGSILLVGTSAGSLVQDDKLDAVPTRHATVSSLGNSHRAWVSAIIHDLGITASASGDGTVKIWTICATSPPRCSHTLSRHHGEVRALALGCSGTLLASGGDDGRILLWSIASKTLMGELRSSEGARIGTLAMCGSVLVSAGNERSDEGSNSPRILRLWDMRTRKLVASAPTEHLGNIHATALVRAAHHGHPGHVDEYVLATGSTDGLLQVMTRSPPAWCLSLSVHGSLPFDVTSNRDPHPDPNPNLLT